VSPERARWLLRLYPPAWRARYEEELLALLEDTPLTARAAIDLLLGALDAHARPQIPRLDRPEPAAAAPTPAELAPASEPPRRRVGLTAGTPGWESWIDILIHEAEARGAFDDLSGAGKPLDLTDDSLAGDQALGFRILKEQGETLPWIWLGREIDADQSRMDELLTQARGTSGPSRERLRERYLELATELDKKLARYNQQIPTYRLDRGRLPAHLAAQRFDAV
jgi:hypothetical protein